MEHRLTGTSLCHSVARQTLSQEAFPCWCGCYACISATQVLDNRQWKSCSFSVMYSSASAPLRDICFQATTLRAAALPVATLIFLSRHVEFVVLSSLTVLSFGCNCCDHDGFRLINFSLCLVFVLGQGFGLSMFCPFTFGHHASKMGEPTMEGLAKARRVRGGHRGLCTKLVVEANMIVGKSSLPERQGIRLSPEEASRLVGYRQHVGEAAGPVGETEH